MSSIARLTNNSDETDVASLISKDNIFSIPFFQRPYKWKPERVKKIQEDILALVDQTSDFHFLGAVIVHGRRTNPSDPDVFEVIDGQQRLTTIYLLLCAAVKILNEAGEHDEASGIFLKYVAINRTLANLSNARLHSCKEDRAQLNAVIRELLNDPKFREKLGSFKFKALPIVANTKDKGTLRTNYNSMVRFLKAELLEGDIVRVRQIYTCLLNKVTIVQIDIKDPASGPAIFDSLNSRQEPMTIGDLVRNGIFSKVADQEPDEIEVIDRDYWQPFYKKFESDGQNFFDAFFFPYGLIQNPNLKKTDIYNSLQKQWTDVDDPIEIIDRLRDYQAPFMDLMLGTNRMEFGRRLADAFRRLNKLGLPGSTLPFLMRLSAEIGKGTPDEDIGLAILEIIESFLVRRAACGIEPTGLHAVFKRLWQDLKGDITAENVRKQIAQHKTVAWPGDDEFARSIETRPLFGANVTPYLLVEFDKSLGGDHPNDIHWIEHVLPQNPENEWWDIIDKESHKQLVDVLANLLPLSSDMNRELGNKLYSKKKSKYQADSMFKSTRNFAESYETWDKNGIESRAKTLSAWATKRWLHSS